MMTEEWRDVPGYEGFYQVSDFGNVRSVTRTDALGRIWQGQAMRCHTDRDGYKKLELNRQGQGRRWFCHQLVAMAFIGTMPSGYTVNHKNGVKGDNRFVNLEYMTREENAMHSLMTLGHLRRGSDHPYSKLTPEIVKSMREFRASGLTYRAIGEIFGTGLTTVYAAVNKQNWGWLN